MKEKARRIRSREIPVKVTVNVKHVVCLEDERPVIFIKGPDAEYEFDRAAAVAFLGELDAFGDQCSDGCKKLREGLRGLISQLAASSPCSP